VVVEQESTLDVQLLQQGSRQGQDGALLYDFEYELDSTRGRKRIFDTVTIQNSRLYILSGSYKCDINQCGESGTPDLVAMRSAAASFDVDK
jgi:PsbP